MVLKSLKVKDVSFGVPVTGKMKPGFKNFHSNILQAHKVAPSPHERAVRRPLPVPHASSGTLVQVITFKGWHRGWKHNKLINQKKNDYISKGDY